MPKQTFFNLPPEKRAYILDCVVDEFAEQGFDKASISRIVAAAGIAKGSFYQYFEDKADLYEYIIVELVSKRQMNIFEQEAGVLETLSLTGFLRHVCHLQMQYFCENPKLLKIGMDFAKHITDPVQQQIANRYQDKDISSSYFHPYIQAEKAQGGIDEKVDDDILNFMLISLGQYLSHLMTTGNLESVNQALIDNMIDKLEYILTNGIYTKHGEG